MPTTLRNGPAQTAVPAGRLSRRTAGILFAGLLQAGFVWALMAGLDIRQVTEILRDPIKVVLPRTEHPPATPPTAREVDVTIPRVPLPDIAIDTGAPRETALTAQPVQTATASGPAYRGPASVVNTHTIPPYPPIDIRLGREGTVLLRLTIAADGRVTNAVVVRSAGSDTLDEAAKAWVMANWRYRPAMRGGVAEASQTNVAVTFSLKNAR